MIFLRPLAVLLLAASLAGNALARGPVDDETIFTRVEGSLQRARSLAGLDIKVEAREGFVTLSGAARTAEQVATAGRLARSVRGVSGVSNEIRVTLRPSRA